MEILKAVIFGIVEGITEWLPISSTGHMILLDEFVQLKGSQDFINVFLVVVQLGAILAVVFMFWNDLFPFRFRKGKKPEIEKDKMILWGKILLACIPAAIVGILFDQVFERLFYHPVPVMMGASLLRILQHGFYFSGTEWAVMAAGMAAAFLVSVGVIRFLLDYIRKHDFQIFGWYRILLGILVIGLNMMGMIHI